jgi:hypothetical protein
MKRETYREGGTNCWPSWIGGRLIATARRAREEGPGRRSDKRASRGTTSRTVRGYDAGSLNDPGRGGVWTGGRGQVRDCLPTAPVLQWDAPHMRAAARGTWAAEARVESEGTEMMWL